MRTFMYIALLFWISNGMQAQDTLFKVDGSAQLVKVLEINETQVKYKLHANPEGPTYVIGKDRVSSIVYAHGIIEVFPIGESGHLIPGLRIDPRVTDFGRNFIAVNILDLFQNTLTLSYEYTFKSGHMSVKLPLSLRYSQVQLYYNDKIFGTGIDFNLYPYGQGTTKFFYGPSFEYKRFKSFSGPNGISSAFAFLFQIGVLIQPEKHLNISLNAGLGYARLIRDEPVYYYSNGEVATKLGINIGYKF